MPRSTGQSVQAQPNTLLMPTHPLMAIMGCVPGYCWPPKGFWANRVNKFLGLRFIINGEVHYGWARFSVRSGYFLFALKLSGYAYETSPDTTILAGDGASVLRRAPVPTARRMRAWRTLRRCSLPHWVS